MAHSTSELTLMQRFILEANIARFQALLGQKQDDVSHRTLAGLLEDAQRDLAALPPSDWQFVPSPPRPRRWSRLMPRGYRPRPR